jgi:two-component system, LytTR family, sensor kinase
VAAATAAQSGQGFVAHFPLCRRLPGRRLPFSSADSVPPLLLSRPPGVSLMPHSFVGRVFSLNVDRLGFSRIPWGAMSSSQPARPEGARRSIPILVSVGWGRKALAIVAGWTLFGLCAFAACLLADAAIGSDSMPWRALLAYSLGAAWIWAALTPPVFWLTRSAGFSDGHRLRIVLLHAATAAGFVLLSVTLQSVLAGATRIDTSGVSPLLPRVENSLLAYAALVVMARAAHYFALLKTRQVHASQLEARLAKTHLQLLRMQLQPHFLFNTLNTVAELVHSEPDTADQMITRLGRLLRLSLDHAGHQVVPLRQEIDFLRMYVEIEQVRFQDRLQIVWDVDPDTLDAAVPTLLWHPVLENAIRHGVTPLVGRGRIVIASQRVGDDLILEIRDNGRGLPQGGQILREGVGLRNIRERVDQLYGSRAHFSLEPAAGGGTVATLRLPFTHCDAAHTPVPLSQRDLEELVG